MSKLEKAILSMVEVFEEYAGRDDKKRELSGAELSELLKSQLSSTDFTVRTWWALSFRSYCINCCLDSLFT